MRENKKSKKGIIIFSLLMLALLIGGFFLAPFFLKGNNKVFNFPAFKKDDGFMAKTGDWLKTNVSDKFDGGVGEAVNDAQQNVGEEIKNQKNNLEKNSTNTVKKFIAQKVLDYLGVKPDELSQAACPEPSSP